MNIEEFRAGRWQQRYQYKSFEPEPVNHEWTWHSPAINELLEQATIALGKLDAFSRIVPDVDLFIEMHVVKEAQTSSSIEGTQTSMDEAMLPEEQVDPERRDDWLEVRNYIDAINMATQRRERLPLSNRLIRETHALLMRGVRGQHKFPGEFRRSQNWIGGSSLKDAVFIPPHPDSVPNLMSDLEAFWHNDQIHTPHLIRAAISHYQFETIHPFADGNGRIGRLLIPLYLIDKGLLARPTLYLSDFFERHRASYYDALMRVRQANDLEHWVRFFLNGVAETAGKGCRVFEQIEALRTDVEQRVLRLGRKAERARAALNMLYRQPIVTAKMLAEGLDVSPPTAQNLLRDLERLGILKEQTGQQRGRIYMFESYFTLFLS